MTNETKHQQLSSALSAKIEEAFPPMDMPPIGSVTVHDGGSWLEKSICPDCDYGQKQLADWDQKITSGQLDAFPVCDVFCLSAIGMKWALPHYLRRCIANGFYDDLMKDRLVFHLHPEPEFRQEVLESISLLNRQQIDCLKLFLEWCSSETDIGEHMIDEIAEANQFLDSLLL